MDQRLFTAHEKSELTGLPARLPANSRTCLSKSNRIRDEIRRRVKQLYRVREVELCNITSAEE